MCRNFGLQPQGLLQAGMQQRCGNLNASLAAQFAGSSSGCQIDVVKDMGSKKKFLIFFDKRVPLLAFSYHHGIRFQLTNSSKKKNPPGAASCETSKICRAGWCRRMIVGRSYRCLYLYCVILPYIYIIIYYDIL
jgi:hypothetical protein